MANLAIRGHATRGKEVIEILEMLGGKNSTKLVGSASSCGYYIDSNGNIAYHYYSSSYFNDAIRLTIEEFFEKFPYKVGDKVYNIVHNENQTITDLVWSFQENEVVYKTNNNEYVYVNYFGKRFSYKIPNGYEFECVRKNEIILKPIKPKYPRDYDECCEVLSLGEDGRLFTKGYKASIIQDFQKLLICRDAYWKIAGEQMGLNPMGFNPWEFENPSRRYVFTIENFGGNILKNAVTARILNRILVFPTEEMRDAFYENFEELIETCKELL